MEVTERFLTARANWRKTDCPVYAFRGGNTRELSWGVECDLDHQASYINTLLLALDRRDPHWDFQLRASNERRDLDDFRARLASLEEDLPPHAPELLTYMD